MLRHMMKSKIHRATVTEANLNYMGSITIDRDILEATNILPNEKVQIVNNHNGARLETYVIEGEAGSKTICLNGAAARLVQEGDTIIIISYAVIDDKQCRDYEPIVAFMNEDNTIQSIKNGEKERTVYPALTGSKTPTSRF
ncbi:aspartate 1-decarboxylase [Terrilactibacillus sp. BCM23-1]|uniref:Aspartate 1-decarboxylase n=1 Tax=Terrilactibacillus tamarindi TaxID=2599694 RepID=A0A6N8CSF4_9BACI|nr:aspartate 1-decarboxylase [Terrilactibacillus tamarindi]MTT32620.1 aspartate 1-decarboxylase [Terrilactibacillus tamarindi]